MKLKKKGKRKKKERKVYYSKWSKYTGGHLVLDSIAHAHMDTVNGGHSLNQSIKSQD